MIDVLVLVLIPLAANLVITALAFALMKRLGAKRVPLTVASAAVFPAVAAALAVYVEHSGRDLHGIVTTLLAATGVVSVPITFIAAWLLTKRYAS